MRLGICINRIMTIMVHYSRNGYPWLNCEIPELWRNKNRCECSINFTPEYKYSYIFEYSCIWIIFTIYPVQYMQQI